VREYKRPMYQKRHYEDAAFDIKNYNGTIKCRIAIARLMTRKEVIETILKQFDRTKDIKQATEDLEEVIDVELEYCQSELEQCEEQHTPHD